MKFYLLVIAAVSFLTYISCGLAKTQSNRSVPLAQFADGCIQCNSKDNERCATDPLSLLNRNCSDGTSNCYSRVLNGYTIRGCAVDLDNATRNACTNELECQLCTYTEGCNRNTFPLTRLQCLQCSGNSTSSSCATETYATAKICPLYKFGDQCYIRNSNRTADGTFQRGCLSSATANKQCVKAGNCFVCDGRACNFLHANDTQIPLARDSGVQVTLSVFLMIGGLLAAWRL
ncbi:uncharacterized protein LOC119558006 isoform X1 [Drosophila subpulchrella]|uniref:uncharacterized protein LOC119558006 isoform X1 n=1 Tax=Drosophila subpulchrella TaxID=1486046 RepID=UPI0018A195E0|nr:uncharacterized protein LOC119558006 isoform X1 [Drosophila subpulchrella]